jgi:hypothetical protein
MHTKSLCYFIICRNSHNFAWPRHTAGTQRVNRSTLVLNFEANRIAPVPRENKMAALIASAEEGGDVDDGRENNTLGFSRAFDERFPETSLTLTNDAFTTGGSAGRAGRFLRYTIASAAYLRPR